MTASGTDERVWLITGASSGLGRALAEAVLARGEFAVLAARSQDELEALAAQHPETAMAAVLDVTQPDAVRSAVDGAAERFGRIDVVVNGVGYGLFGAL